MFKLLFVVQLFQLFISGALGMDFSTETDTILQNDIQIFFVLSQMLKQPDATIISSDGSVEGLTAEQIAAYDGFENKIIDRKTLNSYLCYTTYYGNIWKYKVQRV